MATEQVKMRPRIQTLRARTILVCALVAVVAVCGLAACEPATPTVDGYRITQTQDSGTISTFVSTAGSIAHYTALATAQSPAQDITAILRYSDSHALLLDGHARTYVSATIQDLAAQQNRQPAPSANALPPGTTLPAVLAAQEQVIWRLPLTATIQGQPAQAYLAVIGGTRHRQWYAMSLPTPPAAIIATLATTTLRGDCSSTLAADVPGADCHVDGRELAGRILLRDEIADGVNWTISTDTTKIEQTQLPAAQFFQPSQYKQQTLPTPPAAGAASSSAESPIGNAASLDKTSPYLVSGVHQNVQAGGPTAPCSLHISSPTPNNPPLLTLCKGSSPALIAAAALVALFSGGESVATNLDNVEVYPIFWGAKTNTPAATTITNALDLSMNPAYTSALGQYGFRHVFMHGGPDIEMGTTPPAVIGAMANVAGFAVMTGFLKAQSNCPKTWWITDSNDPLCMVFVSDADVPAGGFGGYHSFVFTPNPFPANLFSHAGVPFALMIVPAATFTLPLADIVPNPTDDRVSCLSTFQGHCLTDARTSCVLLNPMPALCNGLSGLDTATQESTHELVEAITNPFNFFGWEDHTVGGLFDTSTFTGGEASDLCMSNPTLNLGEATSGAALVAGISVSQYWSDSDMACVPQVPVVAPSLTVLSPVNGQTVFVPYGSNISTATLQATATARDAAGQDLTGSIHWSVDGAVVGFGGRLPLSLLAGTHTVVASVTDSAHQKTTLSFTVNAVNGPLSATITEPADGATYSAGQTLTIAGTASDGSSLAVPAAHMQWRINDQVVLQGTAQFSHLFSTVGDQRITLLVAAPNGTTASATVTIHIVAGTGQPSVVITQPANGSSAQSGKPITFSAQAYDSSGNLISTGVTYTWTDTTPNPVVTLGTGQTISASLQDFCGVPYHIVKVTATLTNGTSATATVQVFLGGFC